MEDKETKTDAKTDEAAGKKANNNEPAEKTRNEITEQRATIRIEGQEFEIDAALAQDDKTLKVVLQPHFASIENANITREIKDGKLIVTIVKRAQHKGHQ